MAFKHKKKIAEILAMGFEEYAKFLKKEINRAAKFGELDAVVSTHHKFADGKESSLVLFGVYTGELAKFFKNNKTEQSFAKGKCFFEETPNGVTMHIALNTGKGKPDKLKKGGKKLWSKLGIGSEFYKGELPTLGQELDSVNVGEESLKETVDTANDSQSMEEVIAAYQKAKKLLAQEVLPLISDKATLDTAYTNRHFAIAKKILGALASIIDKVDELGESEKEKYNKIVAQAEKEYPKVKRIAAKIKKALMASNEVDIALDNTASEASQVEAIGDSLEAIEEQFEYLDMLKEKALELIQQLKTQ